MSVLLQSKATMRSCGMPCTSGSPKYLAHSGAGRSAVAHAHKVMHRAPPGEIIWDNIFSARKFMSEENRKESSKQNWIQSPEKYITKLRRKAQRKAQSKIQNKITAKRKGNQPDPDIARYQAIPSWNPWGVGELVEPPRTCLWFYRTSRIGSLSNSEKKPRVMTHHCHHTRYLFRTGWFECEQTIRELIIQSANIYIHATSIHIWIVESWLHEWWIGA